MEESEDLPDKKLRLILGAVLVLAIVGGAVDLALDAPDSLLSVHAIYELTLIVASIAAFFYLWRGWFKANRNISLMQHQLDERQAERDAWRESAQSALAGFGKAIESRFVAWELTATESEVALQLLKGKSHKEIAFNSGRSERTIRQHAVSVYQKSGLAGRAELAAFFLEDVSLPG